MNVESPVRVLITGATGFLGSAVACACLAAGIEVSAIRRPRSNLARLDGIADRIVFYDNTEAGIDAAFDHEGKYDAVMHMATCYGRQGESWSTLLETNAVFPLRILEIALNRGVGLFLNIDTVLDPMINAYALSKRQFIEWGQLAARPGALRFANIRLEHLYGPGDEPSRFVTHIIRQCLANTESIPLTEGRQMRDFIHIDDAAAGIVQLLGARERLPAGWSEFGLGSGQPVSIRQLVECIHHLTDSQARLRFGAIPYRLNEAMESKADIAKLTGLGWACRVPLDEGLAQTVGSEKAKLAESSEEGAE